jgi:hypothetical protein
MTVEDRWLRELAELKEVLQAVRTFLEDGDDALPTRAKVLEAIDKALL